MIKKQLSENKKTWAFLTIALMIVFTAVFAVFANALTDTTQPTIISVSPINNKMDIATHDVLTVQFSEPMDASTINSDTFTVTQRTTPAPGSASADYRSIKVDGTVTYNSNDLTATFTPNKNQQNPMQPSMQYGNVFTATITSGAKDLAGNSLARDYVWSFTTGSLFFNAGASTTQTDQSSTNGAAAAVPASTQQPVVNNQITGQSTADQTTSNNFPWIWILGALLLLLLVALLFTSTSKPARQKNIQKVHSNPFGDVHPIIDIEGIGPEYNKELHAIGITNTEQLWEADAVKIANHTKAPLSLVKSWQHMAELASVHDIGPQYAELLERSGIHNIDQLKSSSANRVLKLVRKKQDSLKINIQGNHPGHAMVEHWINEANHHKYSAA